MANRELVRLLYVEEIPHLQVVAIQVDVQQNLAVLNLGALLPFLDEVHRLVAEVDAELRHRLKMDCYLAAVDAELPRLRKRMDCCPGAVLALPDRQPL